MSYKNTNVSAESSAVIPVAVAWPFFPKGIWPCAHDGTRQLRHPPSTLRVLDFGAGVEASAHHARPLRYTTRTANSSNARSSIQHTLRSSRVRPILFHRFSAPSLTGVQLFYCHLLRYSDRLCCLFSPPPTARPSIFCFPIQGLPLPFCNPSMVVSKAASRQSASECIL